jgi:RHS repeat-associated protein
LRLMSPNSCASVVRKTSFKAEIYIKLAASHHQRCASSYRFRSGRTRANNNIAWATNLTSDGLRTFSYDANNRLAQVQVGDADEASKVTYLHNAAGQRVFKSEPRVAQTAPSEARLGGDFITWLKKNFGWLFAQAQQDATLGQSYVYADPSTGSGQAGLQSYNLLGEYGNGGSNSAGRMEYIYLPTETGAAQLIGLYKNNRFYAVHTDHLGTPRQINDDMNKVVWQWAYSAFGDNQPTGVLTATTNPKAALTNQPTLLQATSPRLTVNLRYAGQYWDEEAKLSYNYFRSYRPQQGRYDQSDPIGLAGGWSRFGYVGGNSLSRMDPLGLGTCYYSISSGKMSCYSDVANTSGFEGTFASGNNGVLGCKNNPKCTNISNVGPIPEGVWSWNPNGKTNKPGGRVLEPVVVDTQRSLIRTHSCVNPFGPSTRAPYCSEGCVTGTASTISDLNQFLDAETQSGKGNILIVVP